MALGRRFRSPKSAEIVQDYPAETLADVLERWKATKPEWEKTFTPETYYKYLREEIEREDDITHQRITWSLQFQGFLVASMTFLIGGAWTGVPGDVLTVRKLLPFGIAIVGLAVAMNAKRGVAGSREAINKVKNHWENKIDAEFHITPVLAPRTFGKVDQTLALKRSYAVQITSIFVKAWWVFLIGYFGYLMYLAYSHLNTDHLASIPD